MSVPRMLYVQPYGQIGGAERYLQTLLQRVPPQWRGPVVCLQHGPFPDALRADGHDVRMLPTGTSASAIAAAGLRLRWSLRHYRAEVIHGNGLKAALVAGVSALATKSRVVWVKHDFSWDGRVGQLGARLSSRVLAVSEAVTESFDTATRAAKVRVVHNGVDIPDIDRVAARRTTRDALDAAPDAKVVSLIGRLHPVKGHREVLEITDALRQAVPGVRVAFVGGPDPSQPAHADLLRRRTSELGLDGTVTFLGFRRDVSTLVAGSDVVVVASGRDDRGMGREAFPLAALEALAVGTPVVAYADGGVPELLGDCGWLVPAGGRAELLERLVHVLTDPGPAEIARQCGPARVRREFSVEAMVTRTLDVYREAAGSVRRDG